MEFLLTCLIFVSYWDLIVEKIVVVCIKRIEIKMNVNLCHFDEKYLSSGWICTHFGKPEHLVRHYRDLKSFPKTSRRCKRKQSKSACDLVSVLEKRLRLIWFLCWRSGWDAEGLLVIFSPVGCLVEGTPASFIASGQSPGAAKPSQCDL